MALVKSQYTRARALRPLLLVGITKSRYFVSLFVSHNPITGIPIFSASWSACASASGSVTISNSGSKKLFEFVLYTDDKSLDSFKKSVGYLETLNLPYKLGNVDNFLSDFTGLAHCDYVISTPSTLCITASFCGKKNKKIIHSYDFIMNYKYKSDYFRDIFWKKLVDLSDNNDYNIYKLI